MNSRYLSIVLSAGFLMSVSGCGSPQQLQQLLVTEVKPPPVAEELLTPVGRKQCLDPGAGVYTVPELEQAVICERGNTSRAVSKHAGLASAVRVREAAVKEAK